MNDLFSMKNRVAIVTGASRGIGEAIAMQLAEAGAAVVLSARKLEGLLAVASHIKATGGKAEAIAAHAGKPDDVAHLVQGAIKFFGKVDVLVNNAATNPYFGPLMEITDAAWEKTFEVNLKGYFSCAREVIRHLQERNAPGSIVNVASVAGIRAAPFQACYGMTKAAVISMTQSLAQELGASRIRVNAIAPGLVDTKFASALVQNDEVLKRINERAALGRHGRPEEIAGAALYLASDASSFVTGHTLVVDGGSTITGF